MRGSATPGSSVARARCAPLSMCAALGLRVALALCAVLFSLLLVASGVDAQARSRRPRRLSPRARIAALEAELSAAEARAATAEAAAAASTERATVAESAAADAEARAARAEQRASAAEAAAREANLRAVRAEARAAERARGRRAERPANDERTSNDDRAAPTDNEPAEADAAPSDAPNVSPDAELPRGRALADLDATGCLERLRTSGARFDTLAEEDARGVRTPVRLRGPLGGVTIAPRNDPQRSPHAILDCRLALALLAWAPTLRAAHITKVEHYSAFRAGARVGGRGPVSGHASGMALDAALFHTDDGEVLDVLVDWEDRTRGADPCAPRDAEPARSHTLRSVVCDAVRAELFQVVLTPHHDAAHQNHVHLELRPAVDWSFIR